MGLHVVHDMVRLMIPTMLQRQLTAFAKLTRHDEQGAKPQPLDCKFELYYESSAIRKMHHSILHRHLNPALIAKGGMRQ